MRGISQRQSFLWFTFKGVASITVSVLTFYISYIAWLKLVSLA